MIHRIRTAHEFSRLDAEGIQVRTDVLWCKFLADPAMSPPRVAFSIGRAHGHAVRRNLARRRLRELLRRQAQLNLLPSGALMIGIIRSKSEHMFDMTPEMLAQQVQQLVEGLSTQ
ncbi:MAG: ribonuclease P protein component [Acidimicrobiaceae bacterium]